MITTSNLFEDNKDIKFHMEKMINWDPIVKLKEQDFKDAKTYKETGDEMLAYAPENTEGAVEGYKDAFVGFGEICAKDILPNARLIEEEGFKLENGKVIHPKAFDKNVQILTENGYMGLLMAREYGGWQFPNTANVIGAELISAADTGMATLIGTQDLGDIIYRFASEEQKKKYIPKIASGEMGAAMLLTEPNYGSDLQNAQTKGVAVDDERKVFKVSGVKQFITHGSPHTPEGQVYLTVTRTVEKDGKYRNGAAGLSMTLIESKDAEISALEHKLGIHSSPTVQLTLDNARGELVGEEGQGLITYTMALMNAARLGVAGQGLGTSERAYREAVEYANIREQFGKLIKDIPAVNRMLQKMKLSVEASRALVYYTGFVVDMYEGLEAKYHREGKTAKEIRKIPEVIQWSKLAKVMTPFAKLYACEECNTNAYDAMQVFGGVGYSEEYDIAKVLRDARILSIYEGTSQLQVVAAIGGVLEGYAKEGATLLALQKEIRDNLNVSDDLKPYVDKVVQAEKAIFDFIPTYKEQSKEYKDAYARDIVWASCMIFISHEFLRMAERDETGEKAKSAKTYINNTLGVVAGNIETMKQNLGNELIKF